MDLTDIGANRLLHLVILTVVVLTIVGIVDGLANPTAVYLAVAPIVTWMLGKYYERSIVLQADLVESETLRELEREKARFLFSS